jgi:3'(2'), 5'-bisphosphate nucleotidase
MSYDRELEVALEAAARAGRALLERYARFEVIPDAPADITTDADRESQEIILTHIREVFPNDSLCAEENTATLAASAATGDRVWVVDPIDGTRGFARKNDEFSVMIAFLDAGRIGVGVVLEPARERLTYAVRGGGCRRRDGEHPADIACQVSAIADLHAATVIQSHSRIPGKRSRYVEALNPAYLMESYSAGIKLATVARGEADLYLNTYDAFHDWDICAGQLLVEEAGGKVTGLGGQELCYGLPGALQKTGLLGSNGLVHEQAVRRLKS